LIWVKGTLNSLLNQAEREGNADREQQLNEKMVQVCLRELRLKKSMSGLLSRLDVLYAEIEAFDKTHPGWLRRDIDFRQLNLPQIRVQPTPSKMHAPAPCPDLSPIDYRGPDTSGDSSEPTTKAPVRLENLDE